MNERVAIRARPAPVLAARWRPSPARALPALAVERHLVIVLPVRGTSGADWVKIAGHVPDIDPRIAVFVVDGRLPHSYTRRHAARLPTLVCSPGPLAGFRPTRGKVCAGRAIPEGGGTRMLAAAGSALFRVLTLFGEALSCVHVVDDGGEDGARTARERRYVADDDVLAFARRTHDAMPGVPLMACDIVREDGTGRLSAAHIDLEGGYWPFAPNAHESGPAAAFDSRSLRQFDALRTAARVLVMHTLAEAA